MKLKVKDYHLAHLGETFLVLGLGPSLHLLPEESPLYSIGVNDVCRYLSDLSYIVIGDTPDRYEKERLETIHRSRADAMFMPKGLAPLWEDQPMEQENIVEFATDRLREPTLYAPSQRKIYASSISSVSYAIGLACYMGASDVGLLGVDFTDHMEKHAPSANLVFGWQRSVCMQLGCDLFNLSPQSNITSIPRLSVKEFLMV